MSHNTPACRASLHAIFLLVILTSLLYFPAPVYALGTDQTLPNFMEFSEAVQNSHAGMLRGVYVPDVLALPVIQQPVGNAGYVSPIDGNITQFGMPSQFGNVGLLAHNDLSGRLFSKLAVGQEVRLVYGNGKVEFYTITEILAYEALQPTSPFSSFRDLNSNEILTTDQMFRRVYAGERHVTFQTCIARPGSPSWGRLFVIAVPRPFLSGFDRLTIH